jgi:hypothetical protein
VSFSSIISSVLILLSVILTGCITTQTQERHKYIYSKQNKPIIIEGRTDINIVKPNIIKPTIIKPTIHK